MSEAYTGIGTLSDEKTVVLDQPICLPPEHVKVIVERLSEDIPQEDWLARLHAILNTLRKSGYRLRTKEAVEL